MSRRNSMTGWVEPTPEERITDALRTQAHWRGLDDEGAEERAKQLLAQGGKKPRFEKAPK